MKKFGETNISRLQGNQWDYHCNSPWQYVTMLSLLIACMSKAEVRNWISAFRPPKRKEALPDRPQQNDGLLRPPKSQLALPNGLVEELQRSDELQVVLPCNRCSGMGIFCLLQQRSCTAISRKVKKSDKKSPVHLHESRLPIFWKDVKHPKGNLMEFGSTLVEWRMFGPIAHWNLITQQSCNFQHALIIGVASVNITLLIFTEFLSQDLWNMEDQPRCVPHCLSPVLHLVLGLC